MIKIVKTAAIAAGLALTALAAHAENYPTPVPLKEGAQAPISEIKPKNETFRIAYMPPATEFNYYIAIGERNYSSCHG